MTLLREIGPALEEGVPADLSRQRRRLSDRARARRSVRRFGALRGRLLPVAVVVVTAALVLVPTVVLRDEPVVRQAAPPTGSPGGDLVARAGHLARTGPVPRKPRKRYLFVETAQSGIGGAAAGTALLSRKRRVWFSLDGDGTGLLHEQELAKGPSGWKPTGRWSSTPLGTERAYRDDLPADPDRLLALLNREPGDRPRPERAFAALGGLLSESFVPPRTLAALFVAGSRIPGVTVTAVTAGAGGRGGAVLSRVSQDGMRSELIFDAGTFRYVGSRESEARTGRLVHAGEVLRTAFVDRLGQLP